MSVRPRQSRRGNDTNGETIGYTGENIESATNMSGDVERREDAQGATVCDGGLNEDRGNIALLIFLYILQGIPLGLAGSIPYLLQSRSVSYKDQAVFSFVTWPFSVKLLWAPIVDAVYLPAFGRRKSWLVPVQYLIGIFMLVLSGRVDDLMGENDPHAPVNVVTLTFVFFCLNFLAATQDIAVDGWALTMLSRRNVGWASTCNSVGQTAGFFLGNVLFMGLESADFCNAYLRSEPQPTGVVTLSGFLWFWGIVFFVTTSLVAIFKRETMNRETDPEHGVVETYQSLWTIVKLPSVQSLIVILLTAKVGFAAADGITGLKLIEEGVPKQNLALLGIPMVPLQIVMPLLISKYTAGPRPMDVFAKAMPYRLIMGLVYMWLVLFTPTTKTGAGEYPFYLYLVILLVYALHQVTLYSMFVAQMSFFAKISDPLIGGTYMTLLNTITNFGGNWPVTVALWLVDNLTWKECVGLNGNMCASADEKTICEEKGGTCNTTLDGYFILSAICFVIGVCWLLWKHRTIKRLQSLPHASWSCR